MKPAVNGCTITYSISGGTVSLSTSVRDADSPISSKGNKVHRNKIVIDVTSGSCVLATPPEGASAGTGTLSVGGTIEITGSAKTTSKGDSLVCEGDEGSSSFTFTFPQISGPSPIPSSIKVTAKVSDAGQNVLNVT